MSLKATVSIDGNTPNKKITAPGLVTNLFPFTAATGQYDPTMPVYLPWDSEKGTYQFLTTFCLGCTATGMTITRLVHEGECLGAVVIVGCEYVPTLGEALELEATKAVAAEIEKLRTNETYLESYRAKYPGFMSGWNEKNRKVS